MIKIKYPVFLAIGIAIAINADATTTLNEAKRLYLAGKYEEALPTFQENIKRSPRNANLNQWVGVCLYKTGKKQAAIKYLEYAHSRNIAESSRYLALIALDDMDYAKATELISEYSEHIEDESEISAAAKADKERVERAGEMLANVEKIQIIDSLTVDKKDFFRAYKLSSEAGSLESTNVLPYAKPQEATSVFSPESGSRMMWAMPDSTGRLRLAETYKLAGGKWDRYALLPKNLNDGGNANYPFMMADGTTLYYASTGHNSIGGYDIFMTRKDLSTGNYLNPQNVGMPYNSPYDDYLLAIDELRGLGWWATDRNQIPDKVTIYIFIPNSVRQNYDASNENISALAAIKSIKATWKKGADYTELLSSLQNTSEDSANDTQERDFVFPVNNRTVYYNYDDFNSSEAKSLMHKYMQYSAQISSSSDKLESLRAEYHKATASQKAKLSTQILSLERNIEKARADLQRTANTIRSAELPTLK